MAPPHDQRVPKVPVVLTLDGYEYLPLDGHVLLTRSGPYGTPILEFQLMEEIPRTDPPSFVPVSLTRGGAECLGRCEARVCPPAWVDGPDGRVANAYHLVIRLVAADS
jgi:hypothetical protein